MLSGGFFVLAANRKLHHSAFFLYKEECQELIEALIADNALIMEEQRICYLRGYLDGVENKKTFPV